MKPRWHTHCDLAVPAEGTCPRCEPHLAARVVRIEDTVLVCDVCLHEISATDGRPLPRRRRYAVS